VATLAVLAACTRASSDVETGAATTTTAAAAGPSTTAAADTPGPGDFGTLKAVCGPGDASGATAVGVTDDKVRIATFSDVGFSGRPGLNQELFDAADVFTKWCNAAGGILGRKIQLDKRDAKLTEYKQRVTESCQQDFLMVGGGAVFDDTGQDERLRCLLPDIPGYVVSTKARGADLEVPPLPTALDEVPIGVYQYLDEEYPGSGARVGFLTGNVGSTVTIDAQNQEGVKSIGWKIVYQAQYNSVGEASWTPFAQALQSKGVKGLVYTGEPENGAKLLQAVADIGYQLDWVVVGANFLDQRLIDLGGDAIQHVYMASSVVPYFEAAKNPATQQYLDLFQQYAPNGKAKATLGFNAFSAWLLFATAAKSCGSDLPRRCVYDAAKGTTMWTAGGLHAESNPSSGHALECGLIIEATPKGFEIPADFPRTDGLFGCRPGSVLQLKGDYGTGAKLADVGKTLADLK